MSHANGNKKKTGVSIILNKRDFKTKSVIEGQERHSITIKGSTQQDDITFTCAPDIEAPKYIKQILTALKGEIDSNTIIAEDFNTLLRSMD